MKTVDEDTTLVPVLIANPFKKLGSRRYVNIAPLLDALGGCADCEETSTEVLYRIVRVSMQIIGTANLDATMHPQKNSKESIMWDLFHLEEALSKCTEVVM